MAYQSLYRRFRPQRFGDVIGQPHLVDALRNAVRDDRVAHAYLLSGPRGTGKTSTARVLAKALNCEDLGDDGEPCTTCESCLAIEAGRSMDLIELDAASHNGVDHVRDLIRKIALGSPGRRKVYILDEVHMFSLAASNALLKTLEEPPGHVVFVLATTEPKKVLATIRSRVQHIELSLVGADIVAEHVMKIAGLADLDVSPEVLEYVVSRGGGSVRDTLSVLDRVIVAGGIDDRVLQLDSVVTALVEHDPARALAAVAEAVASGVEPRDLTEQLTRHLRDMFLVQQKAAPPQLSAEMVATLAEQGRALGPAATVRALERLGTTLVDMRQASDTRLVLEVALVRLTATDSAPGYDALLQRIERLETELSASGAAATGAPAPSAPAASRYASPTSPVSPPAESPAAPMTRPTGSSSRKGPSGAREALANAKVSAPAAVAQPEAPPPPPTAAAAKSPSSAPATPQSDPVTPPASNSSEGSGTTGPTPTSADIAAAWSTDIQPRLTAKARSRFQVGEFVDAGPGAVNYVLPNSHYRDRCLEVCGELGDVIEAHFGARVSLDLTLGQPDQQESEASTDRGTGDPQAGEFPTIDAGDATDLVDAPRAVVSDAERIQAAFPGASIVEPDGTS